MYRLLLQACGNAKTVQHLRTLNRTSSAQIDLKLIGLRTTGYPRNYKSSLSLPERVSIQWSPSTFFCQKPNEKSGKSPFTPDGEKSQNEKGDEGEDPKKKEMLKYMMLFNIVYVLFMLSQMTASENNEQKTNTRKEIISWNEFYYDILSRGEVEHILVNPDENTVTVVLNEGAIIKGKLAERRFYTMSIVNTEHFEERLRQAEKDLGLLPGSVPIQFERGQPSFGKFLFVYLLCSVLAAVMFANKKGGVSPGNFFSELGKARFTVVDHAVNSSKPKVRFSDVAGCHGAKQEISEFIDYLQDSSKYRKLGANIPRGVLLLGPPGCGKTMLAKAVAAEAHVPFLAMAGSEFIEQIGGLGAARVRSLFEEARKRAPCIIYIDEIDAIGRQRSDDRGNGEQEQTLNQLLVELDGMASKEGVIMLASTNRAEVLDKALLRPGRFDRHILIDLPTLEERVEIYDKHLADIVLERSPSSYSRRLAGLTPGFSGADIANICNEAALHAARTQRKFVGSEDLEYAVERVVGGAEKKTHAMSPEDRKRIAVHEAGRAVVSWFLKNTDDILKISITPRTKGTLGMARYVPTEQKLFTTEELIERICVALGGRAAEAFVFGVQATSNEADSKRVTQIAKNIVESYGMDEHIGTFLSYEERRPYSKKLASTMDQCEAQLVQKAYDRTMKLIELHKEKLKLLSEALIKNEVLDYKQVEAILGPRASSRKVMTGRVY